MKKIICLTALLFINGCAEIPQAAIDVNKQVTTGIDTLEENAYELVNAWEETAYNMLDERWGNIYSKAETDYRAKTGIAAGTALNKQQLEDVAGVATLIRDEVRKNIHAEAESMRTIVKTNGRTTKEANDSITDLLISANQTITTQKQAIKTVGGLLPVPASLTTFVDNALNAAGI